MQKNSEILNFAPTTHQIGLMRKVAEKHLFIWSLSALRLCSLIGDVTTNN